MRTLAELYRRQHSRTAQTAQALGLEQNTAGTVRRELLLDLVGEVMELIDSSAARLEAVDSDALEAFSVLVPMLWIMGSAYLDETINEPRSQQVRALRSVEMMINLGTMMDGPRVFAYSADALRARLGPDRG